MRSPHSPSFARAHADRRAHLRALASLALAPFAPRCTSRAGRASVARRVVSLGPNVTEMLFALGAGDRVVGVSRYDDYPPSVSRLPRVGGLIDPSFEAIVALRPDAVVGARGPVARPVLDRLEAMGVRTLFPPVESLAEIHSAVDEFARLVAASPEASRSVHARIEAAVARVRAAVASRQRPRVIAVFGQRPISVAGPGSFVDELITLAGGANAVRSGPRWPTLSLEAVLALAPEVVLDLTSMESHESLATGWSAYRAMPAVRDGRVVRLDDPALMRPGPRVGEALIAYARAMHPGLEGL